MSLYLGENCISAGGSSAFKNNNIGEIITSTIPLSDAGLHLLDGSLISGEGSYKAFYDYIVSHYNDYPQCYTDEASWQSAVSTYGVCGKFVFNTTNKTVRLPKITGFTEGTTDVTALGDLIEAGLPNITGEFAYDVWQSASYDSGAFYNNGGNKRAGTGNDNNSAGNKTAFDASRSSSIYGNSTTVQPQAIKVLYYIVIATMTKTDIQVDIDEVMTDLNGKADVDLTNVNASGTSLASGWSMPSSRYIDLTLGASGATYTAPANGWFYARARSKGTTKTTTITLFNDTAFFGSTCSTYLSNTSVQLTVQTYIPVKKGQTVNLYYDLASTVDNNVIRFIYAEGEKNV